MLSGVRSMLAGACLGAATVLMPAPGRTESDGDAAGSRVDSSPITLRRWEAATTDRLNAAQWEGARGAPINADLLHDLDTITARVLFERQNNAFLDGVIATHKTDVIGATGPTLQCQTKNKKWSDTLEREWTAWCAVADYNGQMSLCDLLQLAIDQCWTTGNILQQIVQKPAAQEDSLRRHSQVPATNISLRLHPIAPQRLTTPHDKLGDRHILMGVERTRTGRPLGYWLQNERVGEPHVYTYPSWSYYDRSEIIHEFRIIEPGQVKGVPWAAPCLPTINDLRNYDGEVMEAARAAAYYGISMWTDDPALDRPDAPIKGTAKFEKGAMTFAPPGYRPEQIKPEQPAMQYKEYRGERLRELGRPVGMPLMMVRIDSSGHNYSSARFDGQIYLRQLRTFQKWLERRILNRILRLAILELQRLGILDPTPDDLVISWTWPEPPHVDPAKEAIGVQLRLETGTIDEYTAAALHGEDYEQILSRRKRAREARQRHGEPDPEHASGTPAPGKTGSSEPGATPAATPRPTPGTPGGDDAGTGADAHAGARSRIRQPLMQAAIATCVSESFNDQPQQTNGVHHS